MAELDEADPALVSEDLRLVAGISVIQQAKERVKARPANQGIVAEVETQILDVYCRRLLRNGLCPLNIRTERCIHPVEVPWRRTVLTLRR
jgi:hypothetical protein